MKGSRLLGVASTVLGLLVLVLPAVLPTTIVRTGDGVFDFQTFDDGCGSAIYAAIKHGDHECGRVAKQRLLLAGAAGVVLVFAGVVLMASPDDRKRSRIVVRR